VETVTSTDGTTIAFDRTGQGPAVILVAGAFSYRHFPMLPKLAARLSENFTVINYDRRGRGDSGDTKPYAVEREIEDLAALIADAGGSAHVWGLSSGAVLALRAAAAGLPISKLALYQPPFRVAEGDAAPADLVTRLQQFLDLDQRGAAVKYFMTKGMGAPAPVVAIMRLTPIWKRLTAVAHTLPYDVAILGDNAFGKPLDPAQWSAVTQPVLVLDGAKAPGAVHQAADAIAAALPDARRDSLAGQSHNVSVDALAPALNSFFAN
jgi:pimeloyl-ACP methyl ester carboxylesterase